MAIKLNHIKNILILWLAMYYGKGIFYHTESVISTFFLALLFLISFYYLIKILKQRDIPLFIKFWTAFLKSNILLFIFTGDLSDENHFSYFVNILGCMLPIYPFYFLSIKGAFTERDIQKLFLILFPIAILGFFNLEFFDLMQFSVANLQVLDTNNLSYSIVGLIPLIFFFKQKYIQIFLFVLAQIIVLISLKRGAMISGGIFFTFFFFSLFQKKIFRLSLVHKIIILCAFFISFLFIYTIYIQNEVLISRIDAMINDGDSSGRDEIWGLILNQWVGRSSFINFILGFGFGGGIILTGSHFAHNDWLEILSSLGILGVMLYFLSYFSGIIFWISLKIDDLLWWVWGSIMISWILISVVSMYYPTYYFAPITIIMAFVLSRHQLKEGR